MPISAPLEITRHLEPLSEKETDEVVNVVADLIVNFLKARRGSEPLANRGQERGVKP